MDLKNIKNTWDKLQPKIQLDENQLRGMLEKRSKSLIDRIDRNVKIGFVVLFAFIAFFILDDFVFTPQYLGKIDESLNVPAWLLLVDVLTYVFILSSFAYFAIKYFRLKSACDVACNLKATLAKIIETILIYQRLFYLALIILLLTFVMGFVTGLYEGLQMPSNQAAAAMGGADLKYYLATVAAGLLLLTACIGALFLFFRWGFRKLYGNYIEKLKTALNELNEIDG